ncbi:hypothetical protein J4E83_010306 [Alternaria metachromatica]|uniref:uncharacterized protein n=1 Tax=Alternaria metachromatica TaxID=283354 RepID=UPI0020C34E2D|nr:uncharacterized protein J4E83_010306 [Alternaria metachromatica]KAI4606039.1 hypothetical protein J4E83_010306 [Alternaria metachromatica]
MSTSTKPKCLIGGDEFGICVQRDSEQGGDELCSYCKDTHPIIMYWNLEQIALQPPELPSKLMLELIEEKSREKIYLNMYKVQLERVPPGKHVCVSRQERFRADHKGNEWVDTIKDIRSDRNGERSHEDKDLVLADYVVCDPVDGEAELCAKCLSNLQGQNPVKHMFSEDGKHLLPKFIGKGKKEPALEDKGVAMKEGRGRRVEE